MDALMNRFWPPRRAPSQVGRMCTIVCALMLFGALFPPHADAALPECGERPASLQRAVQVARTSSAAAETPGLPPAKTGPRPLSSMVLVDYSGSMYGGYAKTPAAGCSTCRATPTSRAGQPYFFAEPAFDAFLGRFLRAAHRGPEVQSGRLFVFNRALYEVNDGGTLSRPLSSIPAAPAVDANALAARAAAIPDSPFAATGKNAGETHLAAALKKALASMPDEGVVWVVTDNIADSSGAGVSAQDAARNRAFYDVLRSDPRVHAAFAYPVHQGDATCSFLCSSALYVYGIYVSGHARPPAAELDRLAGGLLGGGHTMAGGVLYHGELRATLGALRGEDAVPLRLKPLDVDVLDVALAKDKRGKTRPLRCKRGVSFGENILCGARLVLKNRLQHQRILRADVHFENHTLWPRSTSGPVDWMAPVCRGLVKTKGRQKGAKVGAPITVGPIEPGASAAVDVYVLIPAVSAKPEGVGEWLDVAVTDQVLLEGAFAAAVTNVRTTLAVPPSDHGRVYGSDALPALFKSRTERRIDVIFPVRVAVDNDGRLTALLLAGTLLSVLTLIGLLVLKFAAVRCRVLIDGVTADTLRMTRWSSRKIEAGGRVIGYAKRGFDARVRFVPAKGITARPVGSAWRVDTGSGERRVEIRAGWASERSPRQSGGF